MDKWDGVLIDQYHNTGLRFGVMYSCTQEEPWYFYLDNLFVKWIEVKAQFKRYEKKLV